MKESVRLSHFPMPTADDLRNPFAGSDRYTTLDMNHAFHQLPVDEEPQKLFVFGQVFSMASMSPYQEFGSAHQELTSGQE